MSADDLIDPAEKVGDTTVTYADLILIGHQVLNYVTATQAMRHASPVGAADYIEPGGTAAAHIVHDLIRWCGLDEEAGDRLVGFAFRSGWTPEALASRSEESAA